MTTVDCIKYLFGNQLPQYDFCEGDEFADAFGDCVTLHMKRRENEPYICPECGQGSLFFYDTMQERTVEDIPWGACRVFIRFAPRRVCCPYCGKVHVEHLEGLAPKSRHTDRFRRHLAERCRVTSVAEVARQYCQHPETVRRFDREFLETLEKRTPKTDCIRLGIDEIAIAKGHSYATVFYDHDRKCVIDMIRDRRAEPVEDFFRHMGKEWCAKVQVVTMDLWRPFRRAVKRHLPNATIVTDRFHVCKYASDTMDEFRRSEFARMRLDGEQRPEKCRYLLLRKGSGLNENERSRIEQLKELNADLYAGYLLKESVETLYASRTYDEAKAFLSQWASECISSKLKPFIRLGKRLLKNAESILMYFIHRISNGFAEGINNQIKVVKRIAFGFHDFGYFRLKILYVTGYLSRLMAA